MYDAFRLLEYRFFENALLGGSVAALACALIGLFVILRREAMIGDGVAHISFGGIALGLFLGVNPLLTALAASIAGVLLIGYMRRKGLAHSDSAIAVMLAVGFSVGLILISLAGGFNVELFSYLFGSILTISQGDLIMVSSLGAATVIVIAVFYKELISMTFDAEASRLMGVPVVALEVLFNVLVAITIVLSIKVVGMILVAALLVLPGLTALQMELSFRWSLIAAAAVSVSCVVVGVFASAVFNVATSGVIVFTLVTVYLCVAASKRLS